MATRTISNTGGNWASTGTWVEGVVPVAADAVVAAATSGPLTIAATGATCLSLDLSLYANTFTINYSFTVAGSVTLGASNVLVCSAPLTVWLSSNAAGTFTNSSGVVWPCGLQISSTGARTFTGAWSIAGALRMAAGGTLTGSQITAGGGIYNSASSGASVANIVRVTGGTLTGPGAAVYATYSDLQISGDVVVSGSFSMAGKLTWVSGAVTTTGSTLRFLGATTMNTGASVVWDTIQVYANATVTLQADLYVENLTFSTDSRMLTVNGASYAIRLSGAYSMPNMSTTLAGNAKLVLMAGSSIGMAGTVSKATIPIEIDAPSGTVTITGMIKPASFKYISGTVVNSGGYGLYLAYSTTAATLDMNGLVWGGITVASGASVTFTLLSDLVCTVFEVVGGVYTHTWQGGFSFRCGSFLLGHGITFKLADGMSVYVTDRLEMAGNRPGVSGDVGFESSSGTFNLIYSGTLANMLVSGASISYCDASGSSLPIYAFNSALVGCTNMVPFDCTKLAIDSWGSFS